MQKLSVPAGDHTVVITYMPGAFVLGLIVSACTAAAL